MKAWQCSVCKYIHKEAEPPEKCPVCGVSKERFVEIELPDPTETKPAAAPAAEKKAAPAKQAQPSRPAEPPKPEPPPRPLTLMDKIKGLIVKHHAHPVLVHTPNGILPAAVVLFILARLFDAPVLATVGFVNLIFVILALPLVLYTGVAAWEKKYARADTPIFMAKIVAAAVTTAACTLLVVWYWLNPNVLSGSGAWGFILVNLIMLASAVVAGHIGGKLVFKD